MGLDSVVTRFIAAQYGHYELIHDINFITVTLITPRLSCNFSTILKIDIIFTQYNSFVLSRRQYINILDSNWRRFTRIITKIKHKERRCSKYYRIALIY
ncbi:unnamed protein product [Parnassius mnemosyne]|uniref:Uncharacterized protein n=1 Tax=Parnassius mnemosyne TaxID=213953 RepID=A0AAV1LLN7_9NEOP